jgi:CRISPR system Cascade subunit CasC
MKLIELHILQSFPVSCLNRDDVGAPKTATFGGVTRARISSQCLKRAIREHLKDPDSGLLHTKFGGIRSKRLFFLLTKELKEKHKLPADQAEKLARSVAGLINKKEGKPLPDGETETETLIFFSQATVEQLSNDAANAVTKDSEAKLTKEQVVESIKKAGFYDAADISLFGRMVAAEPSLTLEGAGLFSHALSTHKAENDIDFFSAVDEAKDKTKEAGAAMIDTLQFTSACYYRYAGLNLTLMEKETHLGKLSADERRTVVDSFLRATILALPGARKNSMNAHTLPGYVLGLVKDKGQPLQLVNAFENPVRPKNGLMDASTDALKKHHEQLKKTWDIKPSAEVAIPDKSLDEFCKEILSHV